MMLMTKLIVPVSFLIFFACCSHVAYSDADNATDPEIQIPSDDNATDPEIQIRSDDNATDPEIQIPSDDNATDHSVEIHISLMVSSAPTLNTLEVVEAVAKAVGNVNNDVDLLSGFSLQYSTLETRCDRQRAVELFNMELVDNPNTVAVIGCGCSSVTEAVASSSNGTIPVVSFDSTSVTLSDRSSFPNVFRTVPSDESLAPALTTLMQYYGWRKVAIVTEREQQFLDLLPLLNNSLLDSGVTVIHLTSDTLSEATVTEKTDSRIFFLNTNPRQALFHLCKAVRAERHYPEYVWITPGWYQQGWWRDDEDYLSSLNCSIDSIQQQLNRSLALLAHPDIESRNVTEAFNISTYATDALMTLAIALNETLITSAHLNLSLHDVIQSTMFNGASGDVRFNAQGNRQNSTVLLQQYRVDFSGALSLNIVARINDGELIFINGESNKTLWPDSDTTGIPPVVVVINVLKLSVYGYVFFLVAVGFALSLVCLLFNIIFRNRKVVKLTSPNLNYVIVFGAVVLMFGNVFVPSPSRNIKLLAVFCMISRAFLTIGYDICFVVALVKTIRVAYIFWNVSPVKKKVQDWKLLLLAFGIIMIEVLIIVPLFAVMYVNGDTSIIIDEKRPPFANELGHTVVTKMIVCGNTSVAYLIYISLTITFKLIIHVIGLILAFLTRKVKIDPLKDSRYSAILIYISAVFLIVAIVIVFLVEENNTYAGVWTTFVLLEVCVFLGFNFIPKMVSLYRDPKGENVFGESESTVRSRTKSQLAASLTAFSMKVDTDAQNGTKFNASTVTILDNN